jgi:hypothetical protein
MLENHPKLVRQFIHDPNSVLEQLGIEKTAIKCTDEVHSALKRGEDFIKAVKDLGDIDTINALPKISDIAKDKLGNDFLVEVIPFGLRFSENVQQTEEITGSGTGTVTFGGLDGDADVDG